MTRSSWCTEKDKRMQVKAFVMYLMYLKVRLFYYTFLQFLYMKLSNWWRGYIYIFFCTYLNNGELGKVENCPQRVAAAALRGDEYWSEPLYAKIFTLITMIYSKTHSCVLYMWATPTFQKYTYTLSAHVVSYNLPCFGAMNILMLDTFIINNDLRSLVICYVFLSYFTVKTQFLLFCLFCLGLVRLTELWMC